MTVTRGSDFVKVKPPQETSISSAQHLAVATQAAGNTGVICSGGKAIPAQQFLQELYDQINVGNARGCATGRNIFQHDLTIAVAMTKAIAAIVYENKTVEQALRYVT